MLVIDNLDKKFGLTEVLTKLCVDVKKGEFVGLVGPNGVGKTTLIGCICGTVKPDSGDIRIEGESLLKQPYKTKYQIGVCFQENIIDRFFNIYDTLRFNAMCHGLSRRNAKKEAYEMLEIFGLKDKRNSFYDQLSGGMKKRIQIAQAIVHDPEIVFLDEPSAGVDIELKEDLYKLLMRLNCEGGKTIFLASHYIEEVATLCNRVLFLSQGKIIRDEQIVHGLNASENLLKTYKEIYPREEEM